MLWLSCRCFDLLDFPWGRGTWNSQAIGRQATPHGVPTAHSILTIFPAECLLHFGSIDGGSCGTRPRVRRGHPGVSSRASSGRRPTATSRCAATSDSIGANVRRALGYVATDLSRKRKHVAITATSRGSTRARNGSGSIDGTHPFSAATRIPHCMTDTSPASEPSSSLRSVEELLRESRRLREEADRLERHAEKLRAAIHEYQRGATVKRPPKVDGGAGH